MRHVNIHEAKTHLSRLIAQVEGGEEIVIGRAGHPVAKLVAFHDKENDRQLGAWRGRVWMAPDFDELPESLAATFRGESP